MKKNQKYKTYRIRVKMVTSTTFLVDGKNKKSALRKIDDLLRNVNCLNSNIFNEEKNFYYNISEFDDLISKN